MKQSFWARIAFKNIFENRKLHTANLVVSAFTVMTLYLYIFMATNPGLKNAKGYTSLVLILYLGCVFLSIITFVFKNYTNRIFEKRRRKEMGLYAVWGLEPKHIGSILAFETLYLYIVSVFIGVIMGVISQKFIYDSLFALMKCNPQYEGGFNYKNIWITMAILFIIDGLILIKNVRTIQVQNVITLLKDEDSNQIVKKLKGADIAKGIIGVALIVGAYIYVNAIDDFINSISTIFIALVVIFEGSYLVISCFVIMLEFALKHKDNIYYKNRFFTTIAKLIAKTKNNAMSLVVINILFSCVTIGASTTIALYIGTDRQASASYKVDGEVNTNIKEDQEIIENIVEKAAAEAGVETEIIRTYDKYAIPTIFDENEGTFSNDNIPVRTLPDLVCFIDLEDYNKYQNSDLSLENDEIYFISDEEVQANEYDHIDVYGKKMKVKGVIDGPVFPQIDNIKYAYLFYVITKDYTTIEMIREHMENQGFQREIYHYVDYSTSGSVEDKIKVDQILDKELRKIKSVTFFDSNITQKRTRYERNAIFLFLGTFISLIFIMYMIFIMYYKQIQEAVDDTENVRIMQKIGMSEGEIKKSIFSENGIMFFIPIVMAFVHVIACFGIICDVLKLFMLTDVDFARLCIFMFCIVIFIVYVIMYLGACKVYTNIVLQED